MSQQIKVTRKLDLSRRATLTGFQFQAITANVAITNADSGKKYVIGTNSASSVFVALPLANVSNGCMWEFVCLNIGTAVIQSTTANSILVSGVSANAAHGIHNVRFGSVNMAGFWISVWSDGTRYFLTAQLPANTGNVVEA